MGCGEGCQDELVSRTKATYLADMSMTDDIDDVSVTMQVRE